MKTRILFLLLWVGAIYTVAAQTNYNIEDDLDLEVVASVFGESLNTRDFEERLNDPELQISNLDLNGDGWVDYLRVVDVPQNNVHVLIIQAVVGDNLYQDVATIEVEKYYDGTVVIQVVGDEYLYGYGYIIEIEYVTNPPIIAFFWGTQYRRWRSPYYWGYYPAGYRTVRYVPTVTYRHAVVVHRNTHYTYRRATTRKCAVAVEVHSNNRSSGYAKSHPERAYSKRHSSANGNYGNVKSTTNRSAQPNTGRATSAKSSQGQQKQQTKQASQQQTRTGNQQTQQTRTQTRTGNQQTQSQNQRTQTKQTQQSSKAAANRGGNAANTNGTTGQSQATTRQQTQTNTGSSNSQRAKTNNNSTGRQTQTNTQATQQSTTTGRTSTTTATGSTNQRTQTQSSSTKASTGTSTTGSSKRSSSVKSSNESSSSSSRATRKSKRSQSSGTATDNNSSSKSNSRRGR